MNLYIWAKFPLEDFSRSLQFALIFTLYNLLSCGLLLTLPEWPATGAQTLLELSPGGIPEYSLQTTFLWRKHKLWPGILGFPWEISAQSCWWLICRDKTKRKKKEQTEALLMGCCWWHTRSQNSLFPHLFTIYSLFSLCATTTLVCVANAPPTGKYRRPLPLVSP